MLLGVFLCFWEVFLCFWFFLFFARKRGKKWGVNFRAYHTKTGGNSRSGCSSFTGALIAPNRVPWWLSTPQHKLWKPRTRPLLRRCTWGIVRIREFAIPGQASAIARAAQGVRAPARAFFWFHFVFCGMGNGFF